MQKVLLGGFLLLAAITNAQGASIIPVFGSTSYELAGINGIVIDGFIYNVEFKDGTYQDVFGSGPPDGPNNYLASLALLSAFDDPALSDWDSHATGYTVIGIDSPPGSAEQWRLVSPFGLIGDDVSTYVYKDGVYTDSVESTFFPLVVDFGDSALFVWADWTPVAPVPVPAAIWLFGSGLVGLIGVARRMNQA